LFTLIHAFANYFLAIPFRKRIDVIALFVASMLPDVEGLYYTIPAYAACGGDAACAAAYPSHYFVHSLFGAFLIIAPATLAILAILKKYGIMKKINYKIVYLSALAGGLLHIVADVTYHTGADSLYLLWPSQQQYSFAFGGSDILWSALAGLGLFAFVLLERKSIKSLLPR